MPPQFKMTESPFRMASNQSDNVPHPPQPFTANWLTEVARMSTMRPPNRNSFSPSDYYKHYQNFRSPFYPSYPAPPHYRSLRNLQDQIRPQDLTLPSQAVRLLGHPSTTSTSHRVDASSAIDFMGLTDIRDFRTSTSHSISDSLSLSKAVTPLIVGSGNQKRCKENDKITHKDLSPLAVKNSVTNSQESSLPKIKTSVATESPFYSHFCKGSLVLLYDDIVRKVEDLHTNDFLRASDASPELVLDPSTVSAITSSVKNNYSTIIFTFSSREKEISADASDDHPFFVFHKGWSSCNPYKTFQKYKLKVRKLVVGDICVSLQKSYDNESAKLITTMPPPSAPSPKPAHIPTAILNKEPEFVNRKKVELKFVYTPKHSNKLRVRPSSRASERICFNEIPKTVTNTRKRRWSDPEH